MVRYFFIVILMFLMSCQSRLPDDRQEIAMIQLIDRFGMNETIKQKEKLKLYEEVDFEKPQPYVRVVRQLTDRQQGPFSILTTYHENGCLKEYLEGRFNRAYGRYKEFYPDGSLKIEGQIIEGIADVTDEAKRTYIFDGNCFAYYPANGGIQAHLQYQKGKLHQEAIYYRQKGEIEKRIPYHQGVLHGVARFFSEEGLLVGQTNYVNGKKEGCSEFFGDQNTPPFTERYREDCLEEGKYYDFDGALLSEVKEGRGTQTIFDRGKKSKQISIQKGRPEGEMKTYYPSGKIETVYSIKEGLKEGEEWVYFDQDKMPPKLFISWHQDQMQGSQKSWYPEGTLESQREMVRNKKQGQLIAWYRTGEIMLIEEYEEDQLKEGAYYSRGLPDKVSAVIHGKGVATLYDADGFLLHKVTYDKGQVVVE